MAAESEVSFSDDLDGSTVRIGVLRTRWNDEHVTNLVDGIKVSVSSISMYYYHIGMIISKRFYILQYSSMISNQLIHNL